MESILLYLAKASGLIILFFTAYYLLLKKETFFASIRFFLLSGIVTAIALPVITFTKTVWITPEPVPQQSVIATTGTVFTSAAPIIEETGFEINWWYVVTAVYAVGVVFFLVRFIIDITKVVKLLHQQKAVREGNFRMIDSKQTVSPFSFFNYIVYNSLVLTPKELENIIAHEKVHSRQLHSVDMLISQIACIVIWFNPVSWMYKKQVAQNLEFIADAEAAKTITDITEYQKTLLKITLQPECIEITNHFYQSLIKKRIVMLNKQQSKKQNFIKFAFIVPALVAFIYLYQVEVIAKEKGFTTAVTAGQTPLPKKQTTLLNQDIAHGSEITYPLVTATLVDKNMTDSTMKERKEMYKDLFDANVYFENIKRNSNGEITAIKVSVKDKKHKKSYPVYEVTSDDAKPIDAFNLHIERNIADGDNIIYFSKTDSDGKMTTYNKPEQAQPGKGLNDYVNNALKERKVVVVNGVVQTGGNYTFSAKEINMTELPGEEALKRYGEAAKNGALVFTTTDEQKNDTKTENAVSTSLFVNTETPINTSITERVKQMNSSPYIVVTSTSVINEGLTDAENTLHTITKKSNDSDFKAIAAKLDKINLDFTYDGIKRNADGDIIAFKLELKERNTSRKVSLKWKVDGKDKAIPDIYVGKKDGKLIASSTPK